MKHMYTIYSNLLYSNGIILKSYLFGVTISAVTFKMLIICTQFDCNGYGQKCTVYCIYLKEIMMEIIVENIHYITLKSPTIIVSSEL